MGANAVKRAADRAAEASRNAYEAGTSKLVPIQLSIDVAVPIHVAWEEWRSYGCLPEGVHRIEDVERDGDSLVGHTAGPREVDWEAEIKDEREDESFAWLSVAGTDVAGLATFHSLGDQVQTDGLLPALDLSKVGGIPSRQTRILRPNAAVEGGLEQVQDLAADDFAVEYRR